MYFSSRCLKERLSSKDASENGLLISVIVAFLQKERFYILSEDLISDWNRRCCWGRRCQFSCLAHLVLRGGGRIEGVICSTTASSYGPWWCSCRRLSRGLSRPSVRPVSCESATLAEAGPTLPLAGAPGRLTPLPQDSPRHSPRKTDIRAPVTAVGPRPRTLLCNRNIYRFLFNDLFDECALLEYSRKRFEISNECTSESCANI